MYGDEKRTFRNSPEDQSEKFRVEPPHQLMKEQEGENCDIDGGLATGGGIACAPQMALREFVRFMEIFI